MQIELINGTLETTDSLDGWIITSSTATAAGAEDLPLIKGDRINVSGDVYRNDELIGNIS